MSDVAAVAAGVKALTAGLRVGSRDLVYWSKVPSGVTAPWVRGSVSLPDPESRRSSKHVAMRRVRVRFLVAGANDDSVRVNGARLAAALEGARVQAAGWRCSPLEQLNQNTEPYEDPDVLEGSVHPMLLPLDFAFFLSEETA